MPGAPRKLDVRHLVRLDSPKLHGWQVRLPLWHPLSGQVEYSELFSDSKCGGRAKALKAARARRDELFLQAALPLSLGGRTRNTRNTSGLIGVELSFDARRKGPGAFTWMAKWTDSTGHRRSGYSVATYGFDRALTLAIEHRERETGLLFDKQQRITAESLWAEVDYYARTGKRLEREPCSPEVRVRVSPEMMARSQASLSR